MGKFTNTTITKTVDSLVTGINHRLDSPFYNWTDKHPTKCTFYNVNDTKTTLDEGHRQVADVMSGDSPLRYNKIEGVLLYGIEKITTDLDVGDYGLETGEITGEAILPPNSFVPYPDSYFTIDQITRGKYWFRVTKVTPGTLETGANFWKLEYSMDDIGDEVEPRVVKSFQYIADNVGSNYKVVIEDESFQFIQRLEDVCDTLRTYYMKLFFKDCLQTFVYYYQDAYFYDPETIEFIIRNKIMDNGEPSKYLFVDQACYLPDTFPIEYDRCIYRFVEKRSKKYCFRRYYGLVIEDPMSLLTTRLEDYYMVTPNPHLKLLAEPIETFSEDFIGAMLQGNEFNGEKEFYNIIANYFNNDKQLTDSEIDSLESIDFQPNVELYHIIPVIIFILEEEIRKLICLKDSAKKLL